MRGIPHCFHIYGTSTGWVLVCIKFTTVLDKFKQTIRMISTGWVLVCIKFTTGLEKFKQTIRMICINYLYTYIRV